MERLQLSNEYLQVTVDPLGAELKAVRTQDGADLLWPGDREPWTGSAPWLFPVVGRLPEDRFTHNGQAYNLPIHGFARTSLFTVEEHAPDRLVLALRAGEDTRACYPFDFVLRITYEVQERQVLICAEVENLGSGDMLFSLGGHPGLCCTDGDVLCFDAEESAPLHRLTADTHLLQNATGRFEGRHLTLDASLFQEDAIILHRPASRRVTLRRADGVCVSVGYDDVSWLGIWSRATKPMHYVCIEPWLGSDSPVDSPSAELADKPDVLRLPAGETFRFAMNIEHHVTA